MSQNVKDLFQAAQADGALSKAGAAALKINDIGDQIQAALGLPVDQVMASEVILFSQLIDDSGSIQSAGNEEAVRSGHNLALESLMASKQESSIMAHTLYLNGTVLNPFTMLACAVKMDNVNYQANGGTPLYDRTLVMLGTVLAKAQEFADNGVPARSINLIITDGEDLASRRKAADVAKVVADMLRSEQHIIAAMGIDDGHTDFAKVFAEMGIPDQWILTPGNSQSEIRKAFRVFSQSAVRASQNAANFSQTAAGGFGG